jgi:hypothetical protein
MDESVIACILEAGDFKQRMAWIASLNARALKASHRHDLTLTLDYAWDAIGDVHTMVSKEQECCAFLRFELAEHRDFVRLSIIAPEQARDAAEFLFEPFAFRAQQGGSNPSDCSHECEA